MQLGHNLATGVWRGQPRYCRLSECSRRKEEGPKPAWVAGFAKERGCQAGKWGQLQGHLPVRP